MQAPMDYSRLPQFPMLCVDAKSYYASVECVLRGLDPLTAHVAVVGSLARKGSVVLAASPAMKRDFRIKTGNRLYEIPTDPRIQLFEPRMSLYLQISVSIIRLLNRFVPLEAIFPYSVDENFIFLGGTKKLWGSTWTVAEQIQDAIKMEFGLPVAVGIGPNRFLSKAILRQTEMCVQNNILTENP